MTEPLWRRLAESMESTLELKIMYGCSSSEEALLLLLLVTLHALVRDELHHHLDHDALLGLVEHRQIDGGVDFDTHTFDPFVDVLLRHLPVTRVEQNTTSV